MRERAEAEGKRRVSVSGNTTRGGRGGCRYRLTVRKREKAGNRDKERLRVHVYVCVSARVGAGGVWGGTFEISI